jgi:hypothetical protein
MTPNNLTAATRKTAMSNNMDLDMDTNSLARAELIMAPSSSKKKHLFSTKVQKPISVLYFPQVLERDEQKHHYTGLDVDKWLMINKIINEEQIKSYIWKNQKYWKVILTPTMLEKGKAVSKKSTSSTAWGPQ